MLRRSLVVRRRRLGCRVQDQVVWQNWCVDRPLRIRAAAGAAAAVLPENSALIKHFIRGPDQRICQYPAVPELSCWLPVCLVCTPTYYTAAVLHILMACGGHNVLLASVQFLGLQNEEKRGLNEENSPHARFAVYDDEKWILTGLVPFFSLDTSQQQGQWQQLIGGLQKNYLVCDCRKAIKLIIIWD